MSWLDALILGIVQGLAEYLPVSSSGHLEICREILHLNLSGADSLQFDVVLHVATVLSTIVVLWREFKPLCVSFFTFRNDDNTRYVLKILLSCIPIGIVGVCFKDQVESFFGVGADGGNNLTLVGVCLCITALLLCVAYLSQRRSHTARGEKALPVGRDITWADAFIIGCGQAVAVLPGLSRSGTTIATGITIGDNREQVARFSFFMVIIPILGQMLLDIKDFIGGEAVGEAVGLLPMAVGFLAAFLVGCAACRWMINIVKKGKLVWFALYCVIMGVVCILW